MKPFHTPRNLFLLLLGLWAGSGCDKASKPLAPLPLDQLPAALDKAFSTADAETRDLAGSAAASVRSQDYVKAFASMRALLDKPQLNREQNEVAARGMLGVRAAVETAQAKGDATAAQTLQYDQKNR
jgi:hypothetical protein